MGQINILGLAQQRVDGLDLLVEARHQRPGVRTHGLILLYLRLAEGAAELTYRSGESRKLSWF